MRPTKEKRLQLVGSKKWIRTELESSRENFDFMWAKDWPLYHLPIAWAWELDRELNSGNLPFIIEWKKKHGKVKPVAETIEPAAEILHLEGDEVRDLYPINPNGYFPTLGGGQFYYYALKVNLRRGEDEILADLKEEIKRLKHGTSTFEHRRQPGRVLTRKDYISRFRDLAIYRMSVAGIRSKEQMSWLSSEMITPKKIKTRRGVPTKGETLDMSFSNWNHKRAATIKRIVERLRSLKWCAELAGVGQDKNPRPNWFDNFIDLDGW
jgi:hypothetical protein